MDPRNCPKGTLDWNMNSPGWCQACVNSVLTKIRIATCLRCNRAVGMLSEQLGMRVGDAVGPLGQVTVFPGNGGHSFQSAQAQQMPPPMGFHEQQQPIFPTHARHNDSPMSGAHRWTGRNGYAFGRNTNLQSNFPRQQHFPPQHNQTLLPKRPHAGYQRDDGRSLRPMRVAASSTDRFKNRNGGGAQDAVRTAAPKAADVAQAISESAADAQSKEPCTSAGDVIVFSTPAQKQEYCEKNAL